MASTQSTKEHPAATLLSRAHPALTTSEIFRDKIQKRPLLLRPSSPDPSFSSDARTARQTLRRQKALSTRRSNKPKPLSAKQKRALGVHDISKEQIRYAVFLPLWRMWCAYIREVLGVAGQGGENRYLTPAGAGPMLASADFHGALVEVVRSRCVGRVGIKGVVVKDRKFVFEIVTERDQVRVVPKEHTVFRFEVPLQAADEGADSGAKDEEEDGRGKRKPLVFELHGSQFESRAPDRANKKFKMHIDPDL